MYTQKDFEKFESVLAYCKKRLPEPSLPSLRLYRLSSP